MPSSKGQQPEKVARSMTPAAKSAVLHGVPGLRESLLGAPRPQMRAHDAIGGAYARWLGGYKG